MKIVKRKVSLAQILKLVYFIVTEVILMRTGLNVVALHSDCFLSINSNLDMVFI
jgi:hypothetical protein